MRRKESPQPPAKESPRPAKETAKDSDRPAGDRPKELYRSPSPEAAAAKAAEREAAKAARNASPSPEASDPEMEKQLASPPPESADQPVAKKSGPPVLSFNTNVSPDMVEYCKPSDETLAELKRKDPNLKCTWVIWEMVQKKDKAKQKDDFESGAAVASFSTVKGFWKHWNHLPQPSELLDGKKFVREEKEGRSVVECLMLFREGVKPEWEDPLNANGGHFQLQLNHKVGGAQIDEYWNNAVLGMVTGAIKPPDMITGVRLVDKLMLQNTARQHIRLEIWYTHTPGGNVDLLEKNVEKCLATKVDGTTVAARLGAKIERKLH